MQHCEDSAVKQCLTAWRYVLLCSDPNVRCTHQCYGVRKIQIIRNTNTGIRFELVYAQH